MKSEVTRECTGKVHNTDTLSKWVKVVRSLVQVRYQTCNGLISTNAFTFIHILVEL